MANTLGNINLDVDCKELETRLEELKKYLGTQTFNKILKDWSSDMKRRTLTPINRAIRSKYKVGVSEVIKDYGSMKTEFQGGTLSKCWYDVSGIKKKIADQKKYRGKYRPVMYAGHVKGPENPLPTSGHRPHINVHGKVKVALTRKVESGVFTKREFMEEYVQGYETRKLKDGTMKKYPRFRLRLRQAVGLAIPQMSFEHNRAGKDIKREVAQVMLKRLEHQAKRHMKWFD